MTQWCIMLLLGVMPPQPCQMPRISCHEIPSYATFGSSCRCAQPHYIDGRLLLYCFLPINVTDTLHTNEWLLLVDAFPRIEYPWCWPNECGNLYCQSVTFWFRILPRYFISIRYWIIKFSSQWFQLPSQILLYIFPVIVNVCIFFQFWHLLVPLHKETFI